MSKPLPENTLFYIEKRYLDSCYTMPTMEASSNYYEIGYCISGDRVVVTPTCSYSLHQGDIGTMPPFVYHRSLPLSDTPYHRYLIKFTPAFVYPLINDFGHTILEDVYSRLFNRFSDTKKHRICLYFEELLEIYQSNGRYTNFRLQCILCDLLLAILEYRLTPDTQHTIHTTLLTPPIIDAIYYMEQHYQENPSLKATALFSGYSASHFSRLFHAQTGKTYSDYLTDIRLRHVQHLLLNTKKSITEIALETGYLYSGNLSEQFKRLTGMSPLQYRKAHHSQKDI